VERQAIGVQIFFIQVAKVKKSPQWHIWVVGGLLFVQIHGVSNNKRKIILHLSPLV